MLPSCWKGGIGKKTKTRSNAFGNRLNAFESRLNVFGFFPIPSFYQKGHIFVSIVPSHWPWLHQTLLCNKIANSVLNWKVARKYSTVRKGSAGCRTGFTDDTRKIMNQCMGSSIGTERQHNTQFAALLAAGLIIQLWLYSYTRKPTVWSIQGIFTYKVCKDTSGARRPMWNVASRLLETSLSGKERCKTLNYTSWILRVTPQDTNALIEGTHRKTRLVRPPNAPGSIWVITLLARFLKGKASASSRLEHHEPQHQSINQPLHFSFKVL